MQGNVTRENKMGVMPVGKLLVSMSLPIMISMLIQALYNIVDSMFVARISEDALTAVSLVFPAQNLIIAVAVGTGVGVNAMLSKCLGAKDFDNANKAANNGLMLMLVSAVPFMLFGMFAAEWFMNAQTDNAMIVQHGVEYLRIVTIAGADTCACCGTHVKYTGSIGQIKVLSCQKYKSGVRVSILCGTRALDEENMLLSQVKRASTALSCKQPEVADSVAKLLADRDSLRAQNDALGMRVFDMMAKEEGDRDVRVVMCDVLPASQARKAAGKLAAGAKAALVLIPRAEGGYSFAMSSEQMDIRPVTKALCEAFGGRGGGPKDMTQGVLGAAEEAAIREKIETIIE